MSIVINNLSYTYDEGFIFAKKALNSVSLEINEGEMVGIIGHTGSGKSTLVQHFNGLIKPKKIGEVIVDDIDLFDIKSNLKEIRKKVGIVFQYPEMQLFEETIEKDIGFGPKNLGCTKDEIERRVREALEIVSLNYDDYIKRSPFLLSGGEKRRIAIAGIISMEPKYLILDEPTAGLDPWGKVEILNELISINKKRNISIVIVSHDMDEISRIVKKIYVMKNGEIVLNGTTSFVFSQFEKIKSIKISPPQITEILYGIYKKFNLIDYTKLELNSAVDEIINCLKEAGKWK